MNSIFRNSVILIICGIFTLNSVEGADIIAIGTLGGSSVAYGVSGDGNVVVGSSFAALNKPFRWSQSSGIQNLGVMPGYLAGIATGVSEDGTIVSGVNGTSDSTMAFRWTESGKMQSLGTFGSGSWSSAEAISADGQVIVGFSDGGSVSYERAFQWTEAGGLYDIGLPVGSVQSIANSVSADGSVIVGEISNSNRTQAFAWSQSNGMYLIPYLNSNDSFASATGVSMKGDVVVGNSTTSAFKWTQDQGVIALPKPTGFTSSRAENVSGDGYVTVGYGGTTSGQKAIIWDSSLGAHDLYSLLLINNVAGIENWSGIRDAYAVTGNSVTGYNIVGSGFLNGTALRQAFLVKGLVIPVPEPSSSTLVVLVAVVLFLIKRIGSRLCW